MESNIIGDKIAKARKKINFSQAQLAEHLFISPQAVGKWERGESIPDIVTINKLANIFGLDLNYFSEHSAFPEYGPPSSVIKEGSEDNTQKPKEEVQPSVSQERQLLTNFSGSNLPDTDFVGVNAHKRKFNGSALRGTNFSRADLTGSSFMGSDVREVSFDGANLTDCTLSANNLSDASFHKTILVRTEFNSSELTNTKFTEATLIDARLATTDL